MEAKIQQHHDAEIELIRSSGGVFDVVVDGEQIFSKHNSGRFPEESEILEALAGRA